VKNSENVDKEKKTNQHPITQEKKHCSYILPILPDFASVTIHIYMYIVGLGAGFGS
jgi:hypothetical protein